VLEVGSYLGNTGRADVVGTAAHDRCCFERVHGALSAEPPLKNPFSRHRPNSENRSALAGEQRVMKGLSYPLTDPPPI
jgi:hypothetical protein